MSRFDWWNGPEYEPEHECKHCNEKEQTMDEAREFIQGIVEQIYSNKALEKGILEHCLDELCFLFNVEMAKGEMTIARKQNDKIISPFGLETWVKANNDYLKELA